MKKENLIGKKVVVKKYGLYNHNFEGIVTKESESMVFVKTSLFSDYKSRWHSRELVEVISTPLNENK